MQNVNSPNDPINPIEPVKSTFLASLAIILAEIEANPAPPKTDCDKAYLLIEALQTFIDKNCPPIV